MLRDFIFLIVIILNFILILIVNIPGTLLRYVT